MNWKLNGRQRSSVAARNAPPRSLTVLYSGKSIRIPSIRILRLRYHGKLNVPVERMSLQRGPMHVDIGDRDVGQIFSSHL